MRLFRRLIPLLLPLALLPSTANAGVRGPVFGDGGTGIGQARTSTTSDGVLSIDVGVQVAGDDGIAERRPAPPTDGSWIRVTAIDYGAAPPCITTSSTFLEGVDAAAADRIEQDRENQFVAEYEAYISGGTPPPAPCPAPAPTRGLDATAALEFADSARERLPVAAPSISGSYAITGLRSWLDLGRPSTFHAEEELDLGPFTRTGVMTATATTLVEWGDGTVTTHTSPGGGYREGGPGPDDITHTYADATPSNVLTVVDTWEITVTVPGLDPIDLTWTAPARTLTFPVREVRSVRDR